MQLGPIPHKAAPYEEFFSLSSRHHVALWKSAPMVILAVHGVTMGWLLRLVTGALLVVGGPDSSRVLSD